MTGAPRPSGAPPPRPPSDTNALLVIARHGDRSAIDALIARHQGRLLAFVRVCMDPSLRLTVAPEDILQETLIEATRKLGEFEHRGPGSFYRWLVAIARFKVAEADRASHAKKRAAVGPLTGDRPSADTAPNIRVERKERAARVREALDEIALDQAQAVRLRYLEGLSVDETAVQMGRSADAVKSLVSRGLDALSSRVVSPRDS